MSKYIEPQIDVKSFTCPYCDTLSSMEWHSFRIGRTVQGYRIVSGRDVPGEDMSISTCASCGKFHIWLEDKMIDPLISSIPMPNEDMPETVKEVYLEARNVHVYSKRAAAALLRLAVQILCRELGEKGKNINDDIASLVGKGLPVQIQQALDSIRVIGNNAVHPGTISFDEKDDVSGILFTLLNIIVEQMITQPQKIQEVYGLLPKEAIASIEKRDS